MLHRMPRLPALDPDEYRRYARHLVLPDVGLEGQRRIKGARILLVGAGGLGSPAALYLAAAGVGTLGLVDFDRVDLSNLQRQVLHGTNAVGQAKVASAAARIRDLNPHVEVVCHETRLTSANALEILGDYDVIVDGADNFATRYLTNDACVLLGKPNVYGAIFRFEGQASVFATPDGPCYRCLFPEPPPPDSVPNCAEGGVLGVLPGLVGTIQATEALKLVLGIGESLAGRLLLVDALTMQFRSVNLRRDPECPACGRRTIRELIDYDEFCGTSEEAVPVTDTADITPRELADRLASGSQIDVIDVREPHEFKLGHVPGSMLVPLGDLPDSIDQLDPTHEIVLVCRSGARSGRAAAFLRHNGFPVVRNMIGGMLRWADEVDPSVPRY